MISLDTETTGVDLYRGALPYIVTTSTGEGNLHWEWEVDPLTRFPQIIPDDVKQIRDYVLNQDRIIFQNAKFDVTALDRAAIILPEEWDWSKIDDCLIAGHVLASNRPKDLTSMVLDYLGEDIQKYEDKMQEAVLAAKKMATSSYNWRLAKKGLEEMPSAKEKVWKYDAWVPRALALKKGFPTTHPWWAVTHEYANSDSTYTYALWQVLEHLLKEKDLWEIYRFRLTGVPIAHKMELRGVTANGELVESKLVELREEIETNGQICKNIAKDTYHYDLTLPNGAGNNKSLTSFIFDTMGLEVLEYTDAGNPCLDKEVLGKYQDLLPTGSLELTFIESLIKTRQNKTATTYLEGYKRYWIPLDYWNDKGERLWYLLHPSLNLTGTSTLRWSSSNPNEQNISKKEGTGIRRCFGPRPGREWFSCDAKNIELRVPGYESKQEELIFLFEQPDAAPFYGSNHLLVFSILYPQLWEDAIKEVGLAKAGPYCKKKYASTYYQWVKNGNFAVQYGAIDKADGTGTADRSYHLPGAQSIIKQRFQKLEELNQRCIRFANTYGYVETIPDKEINPRRGYPLLCTRSERGKIKPTIPLNYHVQGTAMWWMAKAMYKCQRLLDEWNREVERKGKSLDDYGYFMTMQVHDEIVFDFPKRDNPLKNRKNSNYGRILEISKLMASCGEDLVVRIPTPVGIEYHEENWEVGLTI